MKYKRNKTASKYATSKQPANKKKVLVKVPSYVIVITIILFIILKLSQKGFIPLSRALSGTKVEKIYENIVEATGKYEHYMSALGKKGTEFVFGYLKSDSENEESKKVFAENTPEEMLDKITSAASSDGAEEKKITFSPEMPCTGRISSPFGERVHPISGQGNFHNGVDIALDAGTPIKAIDDGTVEKSTYNQYSGNFVVISHAEGYTSSYAHLGESKVNAGDKVKKGDVIGLCGSTGISTGPHLHMEIRKNATPVNPLELIEV